MDLYFYEIRRQHVVLEHFNVATKFIIDFISQLKK